MSQVPPSAHQADVLLITVTQVETQAVFQDLQATFGRSPTHHFIEQKIYYDLGEIGGARVWLARSEMGSGTPGGALSAIGRAIDTLKPGVVVMVGIAFGVNPRQPAGAVPPRRTWLAVRPAGSRQPGPAGPLRPHSLGRQADRPPGLQRPAPALRA
jgi:hypothetical protein